MNEIDKFVNSWKYAFIVGMTFAAVTWIKLILKMRDAGLSWPELLEKVFQ